MRKLKTVAVGVPYGDNMTLPDQEYEYIYQKWGLNMQNPDLYRWIIDNKGDNDILGFFPPHFNYNGVVLDRILDAFNSAPEQVAAVYTDFLVRKTVEAEGDYYIEYTEDKPQINYPLFINSNIKGMIHFNHPLWSSANLNQISQNLLTVHIPEPLFVFTDV